MRTLQEIGIHFETDKALYHMFCDEYDKRLTQLRDEPIEMLEVGILHGCSLLMWHEYFNKAKLHGADILHYDINIERITTYVCNQEVEEDLRRLPKNLDLIIDDGGHTMLQQQLTLKVLLIENLKPGGIFILEDLHTSRPYYGSHNVVTPTTTNPTGYGAILCDWDAPNRDNQWHANSKNNTLNLLEDLIAGSPRPDSEYLISNEEFQLIHSQIESIEIIDLGVDHVTSFIKKKN